jgi:hypothetical protein
MNCQTLLLILCAVLLVFVFNSYQKGKFGSMDSIYKLYPGCSYDNRQFPGGNLPSSNQLGLNNSEKKNIQLANFVQNSSAYKDTL